MNKVQYTFDVLLFFESHQTDHQTMNCQGIASDPDEMLSKAKAWAKAEYQDDAEVIGVTRTKRIDIL